MSLRTFTAEDMDAILRLEGASFPEEPYSVELFLALHQSNPDLFLLALEADAIAGYVIGATEKERGRIISIAVDPRSRRRGLARKLCLEILRRLADAGVKIIDLETRLDNDAAIRLWRDLGFSPTGVIPVYYQDGAPALTMRKVLRLPDQAVE